MVRSRNVAFSVLFALILWVNSGQTQDLSTYRDFHFGMSLPDVLNVTGMSSSEVQVIHARPAVIQQLNWRPQFSLASMEGADSIKTILFSFYNGELSQVIVDYDPSKTRGLTAADLIEAISVKCGTMITSAPTFVTLSSSEFLNDNRVVDARWEDSQYSFTLFHSSYQPIFGLVAFSKRLDTLAQAASREAVLLDKREAPQRELERKAKAAEVDRIAREDARTINKPTFRF